MFDPGLSVRLLPTVTPNPYRSGWFDRRITEQLDFNDNADYWNERWQIKGEGQSLTEHSLGSAKTEIDNDLKLAKVWADHRASAMAEIVRGSFIVCALLGSLAVLGALIGLLVPILSKPGKMFEVLCLLLILLFIWRSRRWSWRAQWLGLRQFERFIDQAAWVLTLGRTLTPTIPSHERKFQDDKHGKWLQWYRGAVLRNASFPNAKLDADHISTVQELALENLINGQIKYLDTEAVFNEKADRILERWMNWCIGLAFLTTFAYLSISLLVAIGLHCISRAEVQQFLHKVEGGLSPWGTLIATFAGALLPALAAAFAGIRNNGEYAQIAARFEGNSSTLKNLKRQIERTLPDQRSTSGMPPVSSEEAADQILTATNSLFQEVVGWQALLKQKSIEPV